MRSIFSTMISVGVLLCVVSSASAGVMMVGANSAYPGSLENVFSSIHYPDRPPVPHPSLFIWDPLYGPIDVSTGAPTGGYRPRTTQENAAVWQNPWPELADIITSYGGNLLQISEDSWMLYFETASRFERYTHTYLPVLVEDATYFADGFFVKGNEWFYTHYNWYTASETTTPSFTWVYWFGQGWLGCFGNGWVWDATANTFSWTTPESFPIGYQP